ncbi:PLC-like phosphodiesterase, TIM beta/alpha-barrel domain [Plasmopara halstedii]|uniref:PLC-like phosphodiesterase, TIM beta/alpha-barrel domain n=1 Tax=Plasmopara halstedii TaxID=4781 RepID=A0A0P1AWH3_PLAHL|nr:PLC-like phosphodiesterase, TIM beta/alpha-barrel domain [Plasmopara halstedii]CEG45517.1 PLC-like phosphodiesterase, TIM beta/alpha-barrel domain [Plasmopara halstedii]|eukprot:XP_024581886.1 PLC-like phosphodiesterase, TIM beta/alpha-barrel domain [Plasmopara halstedii]
MFLARVTAFVFVGVFGLPSTVESMKTEAKVCNITSGHLKFLVNDLPTTFGLNTCVANNAGTIVKAVASTLWSSCGVLDIYDLFRNKDIQKLHQLMVSIAANPAKISPLVYEYMANQTVGTMDNLCDAFSDAIGPCGEKVIPKLLPALLKDDVCCAQISELIELLNIVVPPNRKLDFYVVNELIDGANRFFCSKKGDVSCGYDMYSQLTSMYTVETFDFFHHVVFPFMTIGGGDKCAGLSGKSYTDTASRTRAKTINFGCCIHQMRPLIQTFQAAFKYITSDNFWDIVSGMVVFDAARGKFVDTLAGTESCEFEGDKCKDPKGMADDIKMLRHPGTAKSDMNELIDTDCKMVGKCNGDNTICSQVCETGSVVVPTWLRSTLEYQQNLAFKGPLCLAQIPASHNSAITLANGFGNRDQLFNRNASPHKPWSYTKTNNQMLSLTDQLNVGIRFVEIDTHYFLNDLHTGHCGNLESKTLSEIAALFGKTLSNYGQYNWGPELLGCFPSVSGIKASEQPLTRDTFKEIKAWIDTNPNEFVFVYVDTADDMKRTRKFGAIDVLLTEVFGELLVPREMLDDLALHYWKGASISNFQKAGYQVLALSNAKTRVAFNLHKVCNNVEELRADFLDHVPDKNHEINGITIYSEYNWIRTWSEQLRYISLSASGRLTRDLPVLYDAKTIPKFLRWDLNLIALDNVDISKMTALVWSWAEDEPSTTDPDAYVFMNANGRWVASTTARKRFRACWNEQKLTWSIEPFAMRCSSQTTFKGPTDPYQNHLLHQLLVAQKIKGTSVVINVKIPSGTK